MLTLKQFRAIGPEKWKVVYEYQGKVNRFKTFACDECPGLTITHDRKKGRPVKITYTAHGRRTESPSQAVRWWNEAERRRGGPSAGDGAASAAGIKATVRGRRDLGP